MGYVMGSPGRMRILSHTVFGVVLAGGALSKSTACFIWSFAD